MAKTLPVLLLKNFVILPNQEIKVEPSLAMSYDTLCLSEKEFKGELLVVSPKDSLEEIPEVEDLPTIAVVVKIKKKIFLENEKVRVTFVGVQRVKILNYYNEKNQSHFLMCHYLNLQIPKETSEKTIAYQKELGKYFRKYVKSNPTMSNECIQEFNNFSSLFTLTDFLASILPNTFERMQSYVEENNPYQRADFLLEDLAVELNKLKLEQKINTSLQEGLEKTQEEFILREKIKTIQKTLGEENEKDEEIEEYYEKLKTLDLPNSTYNKVLREIKKYEFMNESSPDISFVRNYLDLFFSLPWNEETIETEDLKLVEKSLNKTHYGLQNVKSRILEYVAMKKRNPMLISPILCLVGPPGVGKSTIAASIASALHRKFYKISVGGLNDSAELTGHRRTYLGSAPGRIITALQKCESKNPLILIDEVDKMVKDYKGDPASVLLDILDANLNQNFVDAYLEEPMDLSHVLFILTANREEDIPAELKDRLEIIPISSYTIFEKIELAKNYLIPFIFLEYHVRLEEISFTDEALKELILNYTKESGVRELRRKLEEITRKIILHSIQKEKNLNFLLEPKDLKKWLTEKERIYDETPTVLQSGLVCSLAVTGNGGKVEWIESVMYEGKGDLVLTGMLGKSLEESIKVAHSFVKTHAKQFKINSKFFQKDVHIHTLEGAIPKDGPSAGVAITTSLISLYTDKVIPIQVAMSGEISLRGEILPVGGIKEKVIGAYHKGIKTIFLPQKNKQDLKDIPKEILSALDIVLVDNYMEIYKKLFE